MGPSQGCWYYSLVADRPGPGTRKKLIRNFLIGIASIVALLFGLLFYSFSQTLPITEHRQLSGSKLELFL